ncbi:MAG: hypothetical protein ACI9LY_000166 [Arenicella sp.]|jgi:hypothetical protein
MSENQNKAFNYIVLGFLTGVTFFLYFEGVLRGLDIGGLLILGSSYILSILAIYYFVKKNSKAADDWFPW